MLIFLQRSLFCNAHYFTTLIILLVVSSMLLLLVLLTTAIIFPYYSALQKICIKNKVHHNIQVYKIMNSTKQYALQNHKYYEIMKNIKQLIMNPKTKQ